MPTLEHIPASAGSGPICDAMERDGAVIVEDALDDGHIAGFNGDLDGIVLRAELEHLVAVIAVPLMS